MVPVFSWLALRGRCRSCGAPISPRYPLVECAGGALALLCVGALGPTPLAAVAFGALCVLLCVACIYHHRRGQGHRFDLSDEKQRLSGGLQFDRGHLYRHQAVTAVPAVKKQRIY